MWEPYPTEPKSPPSPPNKEAQVLVDLSSTQHFPFPLPYPGVKVGGWDPPHRMEDSRKPWEGPALPVAQRSGRAQGARGAQGSESPMLTRQSLAQLEGGEGKV